MQFFKHLHCASNASVAGAFCFSVVAHRGRIALGGANALAGELGAIFLLEALTKWRAGNSSLGLFSIGLGVEIRSILPPTTLPPSVDPRAIIRMLSAHLSAFHVDCGSALAATAKNRNASFIFSANLVRFGIDRLSDTNL
jgi:hypothetical protein